MRLIAIGVFLVASSAAAASARQSSDDERKILMELFDATGGASWQRNAGWGTSEPICQWHGVTCDFPSKDDHVIWLDLAGNNLKGTLPSSIARLEKLTLLNLRKNQLTGDIPVALLKRADANVISFQFAGNAFAQAIVKISVNVDDFTGACEEDLRMKYAFEVDARTGRATYQSLRCTNQRRNVSAYCRRAELPAPDLDSLARAFVRLGFPQPEERDPGFVVDHEERVEAEVTWGNGRTFKGSRSGGRAAIETWTAFQLLLGLEPPNWERAVKEVRCDALKWQ